MNKIQMLYGNKYATLEATIEDKPVNSDSLTVDDAIHYWTNHYRPGDSKYNEAVHLAIKALHFMKEHSND